MADEHVNLLPEEVFRIVVTDRAHAGRVGEKTVALESTPQIASAVASNGLDKSVKDEPAWPWQ
jgi:hypothetical protein